jgi:ABC-type lipoprotein export system ATPase subunit
MNHIMQKIVLQNIMPLLFVHSDNEIVSDIWMKNIELEKGKSYLIEASSGKGKSSLLSFLLGYRDDYQGNILFDNITLRNIKPNQWSYIRKNNISMLFQELRLFPELTAIENIQIKNNITKFNTLQNIKNQFERLGIEDKINTKVGLLSYGQQQRVAFIRSLCQPFDFLLLDEPISHIDNNNANIINQMIKERIENDGVGVVATSIGRALPMNYDIILNM